MALNVWVFVTVWAAHFTDVGVVSVTVDNIINEAECKRIEAIHRESAIKAGMQVRVSQCIKVTKVKI